MNILTVLSGPIVGGLIGYFTNFLAIKMLFKPLNPIKIGNKTLPFTPGIVPKRKNQLGKILGDAVVDKFFTYNDLEEIFLSDYFRDAVTSNIANSFFKDKVDISDDKTNLLESENINLIKDKVKEELCVRILASFIKADISSLISEQGPEIMKKNL